MKVGNRMRGKLSPLGMMVIGFGILSLSLALIFAPEKRAVDFNQISFDVSDERMLYFNNIRSFYYDIYPDARSGFQLYRIKRRSRDTSAALLQFEIIVNPRSDEAYVYARPSFGLKQSDSLSVAFIDGVVMPLRSLNNEGHYALAAKVYNHLIRNEPIYVRGADGVSREMYADKKENLAAAITLEDFFKLTAKL